MSLLFPRVAFSPARCAAPVRYEFSPLFSLFDDATRQLQQVERHARRAKPFNPRFDVKEDKDSYVLEGEVPGFKESDLSIEWNDNVLAIRGRQETVTESGKKPETTPEVDTTSEKTAVQDTTSETDSVKSQKSHQATVEDEDEQPANASAAVEAASTSTPTPQPQTTPAKTEVAPRPKQSQPEIQHWISERRTGQFLRQFSFPNNAVSHDAIRASLQSGILKIVVPKAPVPESRHINIE